MKIFPENPALPKLCHAKPGDIIRIPGDNAFYLVCRYDIGLVKPTRLASNGLYSDMNPLFKVNLETGEASPLPHLSSRVENVRNMALCHCEGMSE